MHVSDVPKSSGLSTLNRWPRCARCGGLDNAGPHLVVNRIDASRHARSIREFAMIAIRQRQHGQSLTEFLIAMFAFGFLLLGLFQAILFYRAKATVDYAAMEAARSGAVHGATMSSMREGMARGLTPLLAIGSGDPGKASTLLAFEKAKLVTVPLHAAIKVISPTTRAYSDFKEDQGDGTMALPNDSLNYRSTSPGSSGMSVQDANILKIQVTYHYP